MNFKIREIKVREHKRFGEMMVRGYENLDGFPSQKSAPQYYQTLNNIGELTSNTDIKIFVCVNDADMLTGGVVYINDVSSYGQTQFPDSCSNAGAFRLLVVDDKFRRKGIGKLLTNYCIQYAIKQGKNQVVIHTTKSMNNAWRMYDKMGFKRFPEIDFCMNTLLVYGLKLKL